MTDYLNWHQAGGPNECGRLYARGIPRPGCDKNPAVTEFDSTKSAES